MSATICKVDFPTNLGKCDIIVPDSDSDIPYFELSNGNITIKIKIYEPSYYGDNTYALSEDEKEILLDTLQANIKLAPDILGESKESNWEWVALMWDQNDDSHYKEKDVVLSRDIIPNYLSL